jgi:hypothetical protein
MRRFFGSLVVAAVSGLISGAHAQPDKLLYELQDRCGKRAAEVFEKRYAEISKDRDSHSTVDYENHYSARLNKCFFVLKLSSFSDSIRGLVLIDLNENREIGSFSIAEPIHDWKCRFQGRNCRSEQEWRELARPFLED